MQSERMDSPDISANNEVVNKSKSKETVHLRSVLIFFVATVVTSIIAEYLPLIKSIAFGNINKNSESKTPTFAIYGRGEAEDHLVHVLHILKRLGYTRTSIDNDWDLLWAHDYPYLNTKLNLKNIKPYQMVNHFPGCGFVTNKVDLSTTPMPFLPAAFRLPEEKHKFLEYVASNKDSMFVEKHNEHRHIVIKPHTDINLNSNNSFVQEYIQEPFLVDGYKFDIGVYVVITSVDPLRVYIYTGDVLFRYCAEKYFPFDPKNVNKYVVGDDYLPTWEVPSLKTYFNTYSGGMRGSFDAYVRDLGKDPKIIWDQVEEIIRQTILLKEQDIIRIVKSYKVKNFFDLIRFDLIINSNLTVYLMEANMSPNLSSAHFKQNSLLYEQILYSTFNLVGIGSPMNLYASKTRLNEFDEIISSDKNVITNLNFCVKRACEKHCNLNECRWCLPCLSGSQINILKRAQTEHLHRVDMKRIFPKPIKNLAHYDIEEEVRNLSQSNAWMTRWFYEKCLFSDNWCI